MLTFGGWNSHTSLKSNAVFVFDTLARAWYSTDELIKGDRPSPRSLFAACVYVMVMMTSCIVMMVN